MGILESLRPLLNLASSRLRRTPNAHAFQRGFELFSNGLGSGKSLKRRL